MRPQRPETFSTRTATKLVDLELIAALLERDAINNRAVFAERNTYLQLPRPAPTVRPRWRRLRLRYYTVSSIALVRRTAARVGGLVLHRRVLAAVGMATAFIADVVLVLSMELAAAMLAAAVFLLAAPPV